MPCLRSCLSLLALAAAVTTETVTAGSSSGGLFGSSMSSEASPSTEGSLEAATASPLSTGSGSSWLTGDGGDTITAPTFSTESCSNDNLVTMVNAVSVVATSSDCPYYSAISTSQYEFSAPCSSFCATYLAILADDLPDCYYDKQSKNLKQHLTKETDECWDLREREHRSLRRLETESMDAYVFFRFVIPNEADLASNAAAGTASMATTGALDLLAAVGVAHVLAIV